ncbi:MAG: hypothetical protein V1701_05380, partial [Planctomycetota bacterium]
MRDSPELRNGQEGELVHAVLDYLFAGRETITGLGQQVVVGCPNPEQIPYWAEQFTHWMNDVPELKGRFVFISNSDMSMLGMQSLGSDILLNMPRDFEEACGTSTQRSARNGGVPITIAGAGDIEWVTDFNEKTGMGGGSLFGPYINQTPEGPVADNALFHRKAPADILKKIELASKHFYTQPDVWQKRMLVSYRDSEKATAVAMEKRYAQRVYVRALAARRQNKEPEDSKASDGNGAVNSFLPGLGLLTLLPLAGMMSAANDAAGKNMQNKRLALIAAAGLADAENENAKELCWKIAHDQSQPLEYQVISWLGLMRDYSPESFLWKMAIDKSQPELQLIACIGMAKRYPNSRFTEFLQEVVDGESDSRSPKLRIIAMAGLVGLRGGHEYFWSELVRIIGNTKQPLENRLWAALKTARDLKAAYELCDHTLSKSTGLFAFAGIFIPMGLLGSIAEESLAALKQAAGKQTKEEIPAENPFREIGFDPAARLGWFNPPAWSDVEGNLTSFLKLSEGKENFIFIGMGGSINTVKALIEIYKGKSKYKVFAYDHLDPQALTEILSQVDLEKTLVISISKSATTKETRVLSANLREALEQSLSHLREAFKKAGLSYKDHFLWLIDLPKKNDLYTMDDASWKDVAVLPIQPDGRTDIGGRFTAPHTMIFFLPLFIFENKDIKRVKNLYKDYRMVIKQLRQRAAREAERLFKDRSQYFAVQLPRHRVRLQSALLTWTTQLIQESMGAKIEG